MSEESFIVTEEQQWRIAEVSNLLLFVISLPTVLAPQVEKKFYTTKEYRTKDKMTKQSVRYICQLANLSTLSLPLAWWCHAEKGLSIEQAIGVGSIPWFTFSLYIMLNDVAKTLGRSNKGPFVILSLNGLLIFITLVDTSLSSSVATWVVKAASIWIVTNGIGFVLTPTLARPLYGLPGEEEEHVIVARQRFGATLVALGVFYAALVWAVPHLLALGMAWAAVFIATLLNLQGYRRVNIQMSAMYTWLVIMGFFASVLSYQQPSKSNDDMT
jgi:hypothetical protein